MKRSRRMNTILNLAENQKEDVARQLADSQALLAQCEGQLADMKQCREDYAALLSTRISDSRKASELQGIRTFIQHLDVAIHQLELQLIERRSACEYHKEQWLRLKDKTQVLGEIKERYQRDEKRLTEHREQFETDELSQRKGG